ncbi:MAG: hypothetical protein ACYDHD_05210 [Vulcanimicrobiaceae bacterium]
MQHVVPILIILAVLWYWQSRRGGAAGWERLSGSSAPASGYALAAPQSCEEAGQPDEDGEPDQGGQDEVPVPMERSLPAVVGAAHGPLQPLAPLTMLQARTPWDPLPPLPP